MDVPDPAFRVPVSYIDKSREYYVAQGFARPYRWAHHDDAPFQPLPKPLQHCCVGVATTTTPIGAGMDPQVDTDIPAKKCAYAKPVEPTPSAMYTLDLSWDKQATHTNDVESFLPLQTAGDFAGQGRIDRLSSRYYGVPTDYSQRRTQETVAPEVLRFCQEDRVDVMLLIPL